MQIDIFSLMSGKRFAEVLDDADRFEIGGHTIAVASKGFQQLLAGKELTAPNK